MSYGVSFKIRCFFNLIWKETKTICILDFKINLFWKICIDIFNIFLVWVSCLLSDICLVFLEISCNQINNCSPFAECLYNLSVDSYRCRCRPGYDGDGISCIPSGKCAVLFIIKMSGNSSTLISCILNLIFKKVIKSDRSYLIISITLVFVAITVLFLVMELP